MICRQHTHTAFISSENGPDGRRAHAFVCKDCGEFVVSINGHRMTFWLSADEQVKAAGRYVEQLEERPSYSDLQEALATLIDAVAGEQEDPIELERELGKPAVVALERARSVLAALATAREGE